MVAGNPTKGFMQSGLGTIVVRLFDLNLYIRMYNETYMIPVAYDGNNPINKERKEKK